MQIIRTLFLLFLGIYILTGCSSKEKPANPEAIYAYIEKYVNNKQYDARRYDPPPPPAWKDSLEHNGRTKPDSVLKNLKPLKIYINIQVKFDSIFPVSKNTAKEFDFAENMRDKSYNFLLESTKFDKKEGIDLAFIPNETFFKKQQNIELDDGYGGFISFKNLYYSKTQQQAIFEVNFYKRRVSGSSSIIYAKKDKDGMWTFKSELKSIS